MLEIKSKRGRVELQMAGDLATITSDLCVAIKAIMEAVGESDKKLESLFKASLSLGMIKVLTDEEEEEGEEEDE